MRIAQNIRRYKLLFRVHQNPLKQINAFINVRSGKGGNDDCYFRLKNHSFKLHCRLEQRSPIGKESIKKMPLSLAAHAKLNGSS